MTCHTPTRGKQSRKSCEVRGLASSKLRCHPDHPAGTISSIYRGRRSMGEPGNGSEATGPFGNFYPTRSMKNEPGQVQPTVDVSSSTGSSQNRLRSPAQPRRRDHGGDQRAGRMLGGGILGRRRNRGRCFRSNGVIYDETALEKLFAVYSADALELTPEQVRQESEAFFHGEACAVREPDALKR